MICATPSSFLARRDFLKTCAAAAVTGVPRVLTPKDTTGLPDSEVTIAQMLKARDYKTMCVGKWHLGHLPPYLPTRRGFDEKAPPGQQHAGDVFLR